MSTAASPPPFEGARIIVVMGVSSSGKSVVGEAIARRLHAPFLDADAYHSKANIAKMSAGTPLTDDDRWPWLEKIAAWIQVHTASGTPGIVTCSSLKRAYRDVLRAPGVAFVHLDGTRAMIAERLNKRLDHFMPSALLDSQLATLEPLQPDENGIVVQLGKRPKDEVNEVLTRLHLDTLPPPAVTDEGLIPD
jgi:gluconokinase